MPVPGPADIESTIRMIYKTTCFLRYQLSASRQLKASHENHSEALKLVIPPVQHHMTASEMEQFQILSETLDKGHEDLTQRIEAHTVSYKNALSEARQLRLDSKELKKFAKYSLSCSYSHPVSQLNPASNSDGDASNLITEFSHGIVEAQCKLVLTRGAEGCYANESALAQLVIDLLKSQQEVLPVDSRNTAPASEAASKAW
ncbi:hypothetical protein B0H10DRAFT_2430474 [Mycena sp. CBHHK59/15]|nr:hypothetical protein B0H10DRAFT_2430474 [Mycena sp. CBHHK59/15]